MFLPLYHVYDLNLRIGSPCVGCGEAVGRFFLNPPSRPNHDHLLSPVQSTDRETHHSARKPTHAPTVRSAVHFTVRFLMRRLLNDGSGQLVQVIAILNGDRCTYPTTNHDHLLSPVQSTDRETHPSPTVRFTVRFAMRRLLNDG
jgi:hypothetical protein